MLKDIDKYDTSAHFSYNDYKKKVKKAPNRDVMIFTSVFVIGVLIILGFVKILSPNVDVVISKEGETMSAEDDSFMSLVDDRLKRLQMEDDGRELGDEEMFSPELDEKVVLPNFAKRLEQQKELQAQELKKAEEDKPAKQEEQKSAVKTETSVSATVVAKPEVSANAKVVVGYYATEKQAEVAKSILQDAGLDVTPVVKNLGGYYTLQVGSYSTRERAQQAANNLLKSNFPARVIIE